LAEHSLANNANFPLLRYPSVIYGRKTGRFSVNSSAVAKIHGLLAPDPRL